MQVREIEAKSILVPSKLADADYLVNPYTGCAFGCQYCYATFTGRFVKQPLNAWGDYVYAKVGWTIERSGPRIRSSLGRFLSGADATDRLDTRTRDALGAARSTEAGRRDEQSPAPS